MLETMKVAANVKGLLGACGSMSNWRTNYVDVKWEVLGEVRIKRGIFQGATCFHCSLFLH